jgi:hypothetical protein
MEKGEFPSLLQPRVRVRAGSFTVTGHYPNGFKDFRPRFAAQWQQR